MTSPIAPTHGKYGALYVLRPNGFSGVGLNDAEWNSGYNGAASAYFEVVIDWAGSIDTFKWRVNGGAWTEDVEITGALQTLSDNQKIIFTATTGHTLGDQWVIGNLKDEATTESTNEAQITSAARRLLNPNASIVFTDSGGKTVTRISHTNGKAVFSGNVANVTVTGNNGYIPALALKKVGYLIGWSLNTSLEMSDASCMGQNWKEALPGQAGGTGSANAYFIATQTLWNNLKDTIAASGEKFFLLQLFNYDPDQDQTGDHINAWVTFNTFGLNGEPGSVVKEQVNFQVQGEVSFVSNA